MPIRQTLLAGLAVLGLACHAAHAQVVLNIDQSTGLAQIVNTSTTDTVNINGYQIQSQQGPAAGDGLLDLAGWQTSNLATELTTGWVAGNFLNNESLAETNPDDILSLAPGASQSVGNAFTTADAAIDAAQALAGFGNEYRDVTFVYNNADDPSPITSQVAGGVNYDNEVFNDLVLNVDAAEGTIELVNESSVDVSIGFITIFSPSASLNRAWNGLRDTFPAWQQNTDPMPGAVNALSEIAPLDTTNAVPPGSLDADELITIAGGATPLDLGDAFLIGGQRDLEFSFFLTSDGVTGTEETGEVRFLNVAVAGDYNGDNVVNAADFTVWRDVNGASFPLNGRDPGNTGDVNNGDYDFWAASFGNSASAAAAVAGFASSTAVPEPTTAVMMLSVLTVLTATRRR